MACKAPLPPPPSIFQLLFSPRHACPLLSLCSHCFWAFVWERLPTCSSSGKLLLTLHILGKPSLGEAFSDAPTPIFQFGQTL